MSIVPRVSIAATLPIAVLVAYVATRDSYWPGDGKCISCEVALTSPVPEHDAGRVRFVHGGVEICGAGPGIPPDQVIDTACRRSARRECGVNPDNNNKDDADCVRQYINQCKDESASVARIIQCSEPYSDTYDAGAIRRLSRPENALACKCRIQTYDAGPARCWFPGEDASVQAPYNITLPKEYCTGPGLTRKTCYELGEVLLEMPLGYSMPLECRPL